jgi:hypothetical protein
VGEDGGDGGRRAHCVGTVLSYTSAGVAGERGGVAQRLQNVSSKPMS